MARFGYLSKILPGKADIVREHWKNKQVTKDLTTQAQAAEISFWTHLAMPGFESWLQPNPQGNFMIHCLEGDSLEKIFKGLREKITEKNPIALGLQSFYLNVFGKDYSLPEAKPRIECVQDTIVSSITPEKVLKKAFFFPLLKHKEKEHRQFRKEAMGEKRERHEASMRAFGVSRLTVWLQEDALGKNMIVYTERKCDISMP